MADTTNTTVIGESITVRGNLQGNEDLTVFGRIEGTLQLTATINIALGGIVKADATVENAIISGIVVGNITASDSVEITSEGRMVGDINAPRIIILEGARFRGNIDMGNLESPRSSTSSPRMAQRPSMSRPTTPPRPAARLPAPPPRPTPQAAPAPRPTPPAASASQPTQTAQKPAADKTVVDSSKASSSTGSAAPKKKPTSSGAPAGTKVKKKVVVRKK